MRREAMCHVKNISIACRRSYKNFGHQRETIPGVTTLWHGFLTFTFIGMGLNWDRFGKWMFGEDFNKKAEDFLDDNNKN